MTSLAYPSPKKKEPLILVFDTIALLSADDSNPEQVWRNNEQLGMCCIPGGTYSELSRIASSKNNKNKRKASKFLRFLAKGKTYRVLPIEDKPSIPVPQVADRQILACAYKLAEDYRNVVVALVTYDVKKMGLVAQSGLPNFCMIEAKEIARWYHQGYFKGTLPNAIEAARRDMKASFSNAAPPPRLPDRKGPRPIDVEVLDDGRGSSSQLGGRTHQRQLKPSKGSKNQEGKKQSNRPIATQDKQVASSNNLITSVVSLLIFSFVIIFGYIGFSLINKDSPDSEVNPETGIVIPTESDSNAFDSVPSTSSRLLALADNGIFEFQKTGDPEGLLVAINEFQELKNLQGSELDSAGEEKLSKLKHKYAIEVLASRSQVKEAIELLEQIPSSYSDFLSVEAWLIDKGNLLPSRF